MAYPAMTMPALGADGEVCAHCTSAFARGDIMTAVEANDGTPLGWYCAACLAAWRHDMATLDGTDDPPSEDGITSTPEATLTAWMVAAWEAGEVERVDALSDLKHQYTTSRAVVRAAARVFADASDNAAWNALADALSGVDDDGGTETHAHL